MFKVSRKELKKDEVKGKPNLRGAAIKPKKRVDGFAVHRSIPSLSPHT